jgi:hypothetical protein
MDEDGYPDDYDLKIIAEWDVLKQGYEGLLKCIGSIWWGGDCGGFKWRGKWLELHTWGWSGNEDIIDALQKTYFWSFFWKKSIRGGHYWFELISYLKNPETIEKYNKEKNKVI